MFEHLESAPKVERTKNEIESVSKVDAVNPDEEETKRGDDKGGSSDGADGKSAGDDVDDDIDNKSEETKTEDWTKKTELADNSHIGYRADSGVVIQGSVLRSAVQMNGQKKIMVHFENDGCHQEVKKYGWFEVPNDRICPVPKERPKQVEYVSTHMISLSMFWG